MLFRTLAVRMVALNALQTLNHEGSMSVMLLVDLIEMRKAMSYLNKTKTVCTETKMAA